MKVNIGPYPRWVGPYQIADAIFFWQDKHNEDCVWASRAHQFGGWLAGKDGKDSLLLKVCEKLTRKRRIKVRVDKSDVWSMDHTLALIIVPMLKTLKANKHGSPAIEDEDVPEHLRSTAAPETKRYDIDANWFLRWDWITDEMLWAFEQKLAEDICIEDLTSREYYRRKVNGFRLFGKYYETLWD